MEPTRNDIWRLLCDFGTLWVEWAVAAKACWADCGDSVSDTRASTASGFHASVIVNSRCMHARYSTPTRLTLPGGPEAGRPPNWAAHTQAPHRPSPKTTPQGCEAPEARKHLCAFPAIEPFEEQVEQSK